MAAGQAGMVLHTTAILQAYQADVLKEMDKGEPDPKSGKKAPAQGYRPGAACN